MTDRRRINGPPCGTRPPVFAPATGKAAESPKRTRRSNELRKIFLKTGLIPSAAGSAYLEIEPARPLLTQPLIARSSALKLTCTVHGPKPLPRSTPFSPNLLITTHVKYAPFAARRRRGYIRDASERDLGVHLETAIRGAIIAERWPKSALEVTVNVLEAEDDRWWGNVSGSYDVSWGMMNVLAGCITAASAAIADARIDCLDLVVGGVAALVREEASQKTEGHAVNGSPILVLDPDPSEHRSIVSTCVIAYMPGRDEITELWLKGDALEVALSEDDKRSGHEALIDGAVDTARRLHSVLTAAVVESGERLFGTMTDGTWTKDDNGNVEMKI
ncbi:3' exoribonuclease family, domain 1 domain containing protein [Elaphomyces granulatus]